MKYLLFIGHVGQKLMSILSTVQGWALAVVLMLLDYVGGNKFSVGLAVAVTLMDACWGIAVSIKMKRFALSELMRLTLGKLAVYGCVILAFIGVDKSYEMSITTPTICVVISLVELFSSMGSMLILFPHFVFLKLFRKALTGEIASKLNIEPEEVENVLYGDEQS